MGAGSKSLPFFKEKRFPSRNGLIRIPFPLSGIRGKLRNIARLLGPPIPTTPEMPIGILYSSFSVDARSDAEEPLMQNLCVSLHHDPKSERIRLYDSSRNCRIERGTNPDRKIRRRTQRHSPQRTGSQGCLSEFAALGTILCRYRPCGLRQCDSYRPQRHVSCPRGSVARRPAG